MMATQERSPTRVRMPLVVLLALALLALSYFLTRPIFSDGKDEIFPEMTGEPTKTP